MEAWVAVDRVAMADSRVAMAVLTAGIDDGFYSVDYEDFLFGKNNNGIKIVLPFNAGLGGFYCPSLHYTFLCGCCAIVFISHRYTIVCDTNTYLAI